MISDLIRLLFQLVTFIPPFASTALRQRISAFLHKRSYKPLPSAQIKNVVVIGGSFAGFQATKRLTETLPSGYRVVLVEKNSHLNYLFAFPRFSVVKGYETYAFIPYDGLAKGAPKGIFVHVQDTAAKVREKFVELKSGERLEYEYLIIATGVVSVLPSKVDSTDSYGAQEELRGMQDRIAAAGKIAVVGGGAVGVELASDIKDFYPQKDVTLIHSRESLLPTFGGRLQEYVMRRFEEMGVAVLLNERPKLPDNCNTLVLHGKQQAFDLIIPCTGQRPNSLILSTLSPTCVSKETSHIIVRPTLQICDSRFPNVFACGDVAATGGPKTARAAFMQDEVVVRNIISLIEGRESLEDYRPLVWIEGSIKLTLGKSRMVVYTREESGREILIPLNMGKTDMDVKRQWVFFGADSRTMEMGDSSSV
ncbi:putative amid-like NADH oxidoreductase [Lentithecium fluviatile CBS 122367]|uniref:Putative amid-like NADH oxidoreductase n=1 Tax=Lentithecium fluviatile CBS 122367 TaxID=1168545 RepID=A0A6G1IZ16_9PLEO|nr:putative amid-like NADH oxidoreductase [Lentithecium fluviatile CBS 122367]